MVRFWERMSAIYGTRWTSSFGESDDGTWAAALGFVEPSAIRSALGKCAVAGGEWPPSLPQFISMCKTEMGIPDSRTAYNFACGMKWAHPVIYETARRVGVFELRNKPERDTWPRWSSTFEKVCTEYMSGARFTPPAVHAITRNKQEKSSISETARQAMATIREILAQSPIAQRLEIEPPQTYNDNEWQQRQSGEK